MERNKRSNVAFWIVLIVGLVLAKPIWQAYQIGHITPDVVIGVGLCAVVIAIMLALRHAFRGHARG